MEGWNPRRFRQVRLKDETKLFARLELFYFARKLIS